MDNNLVFIKLGGSLITDKHKRATAHRHILSRLAYELHNAMEQDPSLRIVLGHGSGSFGHWEASRHNTRNGVKNSDEWMGFAHVGAAAARLNRIVVDSFLKAHVPVLSLQPSAFVLARDGQIVSFQDSILRRALSSGLVPLIFGDIAFDPLRGGTILSTETLFFRLAEQLPPTRILLFGNAPGVMDSNHNVIPTITPGTYPEIEKHLRGSRYTDVTGGMADKVKQMVNLVTQINGLQAWILTGNTPGNLEQSLLHPKDTPGTHILAG